MSVHFISGKPGAGKSLYAMKLILEELRFGIRKVVTNLAINPGRLNEYIQKTWPDLSINLFERLHRLDDESCRKFWLHRRGTPSDDRPWTLPGEGAFIVLDELHLFFNAREWMHTGTDCLHYLSQHRKLGDDVICVTQHVGNVDKQFRSVAQDFTLIVNGFKQKLGLFRGLPMFHRYTFAQEPNGSKLEPDDTGHFRLDAKGVASCYDTAAGIGVHGRGADTKERKRGLHPLWFPVIALAVIAAIVGGMKGCTAAFRAKNEEKRKARESAAPSSPAPQGGAMQGRAVAPADLAKHPTAPLPQQPHQAESVGVVADRPVVTQKLIRGDGRVRVVLSDGRLYESSDDELEAVQRHRVRISGEWYMFKQPGSGRPPPIKPPVEYPPYEPKPMTPLPESSSWVLDVDGVSRLKNTPASVADMMGR